MARRRVFISYAREDSLRVQHDAALLRAGGVQVFIDVRDIEAGSRWEAALDAALSQCERVVVFWSLAARSSTWVEREWRSALRLGKRIVPALLDDTPLPPELAAFQAVDREPRAAMPSLAHSRARHPLTVSLLVLAIGTSAGLLYWVKAPMDAPDEQPVAQAPAPTPVPPGPMPATPGDAAVAAALVRVEEYSDRILRILPRSSHDPSALAELRTARQALEEAIHALPFEQISPSQTVQLNSGMEVLRLAAQVQRDRLSDDDPVRQELNSLVGFLIPSRAGTASRPNAQTEASAPEPPVAALAGAVAVAIGTLVLAVRGWRRRRQARSFVAAVFAE